MNPVDLILQHKNVSRNEARRIVACGGLRVNGKIITNEINIVIKHDDVIKIVKKEFINRYIR